MVINLSEYDFNKHWIKAYLIFFLAASFYLYEYILQVSPSVMASQMMQTFGVTATGFGVVSAFYFYAYAPMQLPAGLLFDRYGPRKLMTAATAFCALGALFFASTDSLFTAALGRFLIGIGSAFSFIGVLVLLSRWFPPKHFAILAGIAQLMSSVGAIFGEAPLAELTRLVGWREATFILSGLGFILAGLLWVFIRDYPHQKSQTRPKRSFREEWASLKSVCQHGYTWLTGLYAGCIWTPIAVFAALWGVPFLQVKYEISVVHASAMCSMIWIGIGLGSPFLGWLSDKLCSRKIALNLSAILGLVATLILLYVPVSTTLIYWVLFVFGLGAGGQTVSFAVVKDNNPVGLVGTASGFNNLSVLVGGAIFQPLVGIILNYVGHADMIGGAPVYHATSYQVALSILPICYFVALIVSQFFLKESHPDYS